MQERPEPGQGVLNRVPGHPTNHHSFDCTGTFLGMAPGFFGMRMVTTPVDASALILSASASNGNGNQPQRRFRNLTSPPLGRRGGGIEIRKEQRECHRRLSNWIVKNGTKTCVFWLAAD